MKEIESQRIKVNMNLFIVLFKALEHRINQIIINRYMKKKLHGPKVWNSLSKTIIVLKQMRLYNRMMQSSFRIS